jgi:hypothetical protein
VEERKKAIEVKMIKEKVKRLRNKVRKEITS